MAGIAAGAEPVEVTQPQSWVVWAIGVAATGVLTASLILGLASDELAQPTLRVFLVGWVTVPYLVGGLLAWWRRPTSRLGLLMLGTGFAMAFTPLQWSTSPVLHSAGHLLDMLPAALFLHVFLAFPSGRLERQPERALVGACYAIVLGLQLVKILLGADPANLLTTWSQPHAAGVVERVQLSLVSALSLAGGVLLAVRWRDHGRPRRRPAALLVDAFGLSLVMLALLYVAGLWGWPATETIRIITFAALGLAPVAFLYALLDARLARGGVAGLMVELGRDPTMDLQAPLARALRDPSLRLAYWLPQLSRWADQDGQPVTIGDGDLRRAVRYVQRDERPVAALLCDPSLADEPELLDGVAAAAGISLENGRLRAELRSRLQELEGSRGRVIEAGRQERQRLERNLHDGAQQRLVALSLELGVLAERPGVDPATRRRLAEARTEVTESLAELRDVARGIYPAVLSSHGLLVALESLTARSPVPVALDVDVAGRPPEPVEVAAYYLVCEALTNVGKHAQAQRVSVRVTGTDTTLRVEITDDGVGAVASQGGSGLRGLADRVEALGGQLQVTSPPGGGTRVAAEIPYGRTKSGAEHGPW